MSSRLAKSTQVWTLATDLGLKLTGDPVEALVAFAHKQMRQFLREFPCNTLQECLEMAAAKLDTLFIEIRSDLELASVEATYLHAGEIEFADLKNQLNHDVYAITFRLLQPKKLDRTFVSVIDCRGPKAWRCYFSMWHELAHLFTLTPQMRLKFCRTHSIADQKDPEEAVMDIIAGRLGFLPEIVQEHATGDITFEKIQQLRSMLCPSASAQASLIGFLQSWPTPCLLIEAELALRKREKIGVIQSAFSFKETPQPVLRAVSVSSNDAAKRDGFEIHRNMRIPGKSIISAVFLGGPAQADAVEDLAWWSSSDGTRLKQQSVKISARRHSETVQALIVPI